MPEVKFLGHACVTINEGNHKLIIDPFLTDNPQAAAKADDIDVNWILLTHGHGDHVGDTATIAKRTGATVVANNELAHKMGTEGAAFHPMHIGGGHDFEFGRVKLTIAHHGGGYGENASQYTGPPAGLLVTIGGKTIYHAGDTGLFYDMKLIGQLNQIDLAFLPIGDNFTMGVDDAAMAVEFLKPKKVVPIHYNTWDVINADPKVFAKKVSAAEVIIMNPGDSITI